MREVLDIPVADIQVGERLRPLNIARVALIADSFKRLDQISPIEVTKAKGKWLLVAGWHRLEAAKVAGLSTIEARVFDGDETGRNLREIEENLVRSDLNPLDRAVFLERWFRLFGALKTPKGKTASEKNLANQCVAEIAARFDLAVASRAGLSARTIRDDLQLLRQLGDDRETLSLLPIAESRAELVRFSRMTPKERKPVIAGMRAGKSFSDLTAAKAKAETKDKHLSALVALWRKTPVAAKRAFVKAFDRELAELLEKRGK